MIPFDWVSWSKAKYTNTYIILWKTGHSWVNNKYVNCKAGYSELLTSILRSCFCEVWSICKLSFVYLAMAKEKSSLLLLVSSLLFTVILAHSLKNLPRYNGFKIHTFSEVVLLVFSGLQQGKGKNEDTWSWYCSFWRLWWISWTHDNFTDLGLKNEKKSFLKEHFYFIETVLSQYISSISIHLVKNFREKSDT